VKIKVLPDGVWRRK